VRQDKGISTDQFPAPQAVLGAGGPPAYGAASRALFRLEAGMWFLNNGSYGAVPWPVWDVAEAWRERIEAQPVRFYARELGPALRASAAVLAAFLGTDGGRLALVENATAGANAVLRSIDLAPGDRVVVTDHGYGAVRNAARHVTERAGAELVEVALPWPEPSEDGVLAAIARVLAGGARLLVVDHVTSPTALVLPVAAIARLCRAAGVMLLVDGAHAPGMLDLAVAETGADWYVGNAHKWLLAPRGAGFLWARDPDGRAGLPVVHPTVVSHGYGAGFAAEFDWVGTRDPSAQLAVPAGIDTFRWLGGERLRARNADLARDAASQLARSWGTRVLTPPEMAGSMAAIALPVAGPATRAGAQALRDRFWTEHRVEVPVMAFAEAYHLRISAQVYNEEADYDRLDQAVRAL